MRYGLALGYVQRLRWFSLLSVPVGHLCCLPGFSALHGVEGSVYLCGSVLAVAPLCLSASGVYVVFVSVVSMGVLPLCDPLLDESGATWPSVGPTIN